MRQQSLTEVELQKQEEEAAHEALKTKHLNRLGKPYVTGNPLGSPLTRRPSVVASNRSSAASRNSAQGSNTVSPRSPTHNTISPRSSDVF